MITVIYDPKYGVPLKDGEIEGWYDHLRHIDNYMSTSTFLLIERLRVGVAEGEIEPEDLHIIYRSKPEGSLSSADTQIEVNKNGSISKWPKGFGDLHVDLLLRLIDCKIKESEV